MAHISWLIFLDPVSLTYVMQNSCIIPRLGSCVNFKSILTIKDFCSYLLRSFHLILVLWCNDKHVYLDGVQTFFATDAFNLTIKNIQVLLSVSVKKLNALNSIAVTAGIYYRHYATRFIYLRFFKKRIHKYWFASLSPYWILGKPFRFQACHSFPTDWRISLISYIRFKTEHHFIKWKYNWCCRCRFPPK